MLVKIKELLQKNPRLKAKVIAKKLDKDRTSVNSCLYANSSVFDVDESYFWSLVVTSELVIKFENKWIDCNSFETSINNSGSLLESEYNSIVFVVPEKCRILLETAARLLALCNQLVGLVSKEKAIKIDFSKCKNTLNYFDRMGFFEHLDARVCVTPKMPAVSKSKIYKGKSNALVEFGAVNPKKPNKILINQLTDSFIQQSDNGYEVAASTVFGELIGNIQEHSESSIVGFAALQKYEGKRKHIQTIISDSGLGIAATLKPSLKANYPQLYELRNDDGFELQLVTAVFTKGEISRFGRGGGLGFKSSREQAAKFDARLSIRQQDFSLELEYRDGEMTKIIDKTNLSTIYGTHLCFDFFVD